MSHSKTASSLYALALLGLGSLVGCAGEPASVSLENAAGKADSTLVNVVLTKKHPRAEFEVKCQDAQGVCRGLWMTANPDVEPEAAVVGNRIAEVSIWSLFRSFDGGLSMEDGKYGVTPTLRLEGATTDPTFRATVNLGDLDLGTVPVTMSITKSDAIEELALRVQAGWGSDGDVQPTSK